MRNFAIVLILCILAFAACKKKDQDDVVPITSPTTSGPPPCTKNTTGCVTLDITDFAVATAPFQVAMDTTVAAGAFSLCNSASSDTWNFGAAGSDEMLTVDYQSTGGHDCATQFSNASYWIPFYDTKSIGFSVSEFIQVANNKVEVMAVSGSEWGQNWWDIIIWCEVPDKTIPVLEFPVSVGNTFTVDNARWEYERIPNSGVLQKDVRSVDVTSTMDACGTVVTPAYSIGCIREYRVETIADTIYQSNNNGASWFVTNTYFTTKRTYKFYANGIPHPILEVYVDAADKIDRILYLMQ